MPGKVTANDRVDQAIKWITLGALFIIPLVFSYFKIVAPCPPHLSQQRDRTPVPIKFSG